MQKSKKVISLLLLACSAIGWLLMREIIETAWVIARLGTPEGWMVAPQEMIAAALGIAMFVILVKNEKVVNFTDDVIAEMSKVTWPNRKETVLSTGIVSVLVAICAMILFGFDMIWGAIVRVLYQ